MLEFPRNIDTISLTHGNLERWSFTSCRHDNVLQLTCISKGSMFQVSATIYVCLFVQQPPWLLRNLMTCRTLRNFPSLRWRPNPASQSSHTPCEWGDLYMHCLWFSRRPRQKVDWSTPSIIIQPSKHSHQQAHPSSSHHWNMFAAPSLQLIRACRSGY